MNGKFAGQLTVIQDQFGVADNILQVSEQFEFKMSSNIFRSFGKNSDFSFVRSNIIDITT